jgi:hypothetical protein
MLDMKVIGLYIVVHQMQSSHISELMAVTAISAMLSSMFIP